MLRELTVRENIYHSASVRLPKTWTVTQINKFVDDVLEVLNLSHVQHNLIGSETERGISGGQRKRVNIGMELAGVIPVSYLVPIAFLDSTSSLKVAEILQRIASLGLTVVSVIHQPRYEIFQQFDDILMLIPGGLTAYIGPTAFVVEYFKELGFYFDALANPADILMDIISGKGINAKQTITPAAQVELWLSFGKEWVIKRASQEPITSIGLIHTDEENTKSSKDLDDIASKRGSSLFTQVVLCHNRYLIQQYRRAGSLATEICVASLAGALMGVAVSAQNGELFKGIVVSPYAYITPSTQEWLIPQLGLLTGMACGLAGAPAGVKVFSEEQAVYWRESANG
ncbi:hypothetical protein HK100_009553 [Physocladia obscura]|uniref:ABC transporter family G domain-containing protein n=1 Tax=Physocladia obscura TaxID=109957 RepID=A0AAD5T3Y0_9FUNG|nr:hypothetical protein HK100_009553 [Physocladia obscura]